MAIYRNLDIGTAKPSPAARGRVPYYGLDVVDPSERFSVWDFRAYALDVLGHVDRPVIVTGGTGLYIKSLTHGLAPGAGADDALRAYWQARVKTEGMAPLLAAVAAIAPAALAALGAAPNERRLIRVLERRGVPADDGWRQPRAAWPVLTGVRCEGEILQKRIVERVRVMYSRGLVDEVRALRDGGVALSATARQAIGYAEAWAVIEGRCSATDALERTVIRTRQLAKRQRTWFRTQAAVDWVAGSPGDSLAAMGEQVLTSWRKHGPTRIAD